MTAPHFYSRPCGRGDTKATTTCRSEGYFYSRPCGRGDRGASTLGNRPVSFLLTPLREGRLRRRCRRLCAGLYFYSRPCGRGDCRWGTTGKLKAIISTHAPAGGATKKLFISQPMKEKFLLTPLREGRRRRAAHSLRMTDFYSRPCGRGDKIHAVLSLEIVPFLLTPLREGRRACSVEDQICKFHFYSRPCGRGDPAERYVPGAVRVFLLTPLREGRRCRDRRY